MILERYIQLQDGLSRMKKNSIIIYKYLKCYMKLYVFSLCMAFVVTIISYVLPFIQAVIIDKGVIGMNPRILLYGMVIYFALYVLQYILSYVKQKATIQLEQNINTRLTLDIVKYYLHSREYEFNEQIGSDIETLISRDVIFFVKFILNVIQDTLINIISFMMSIAALIQIKAELAFIIVFIQFFAIVIRFLFNKIIEKNNRRTHRLAVKFTSVLNEYVNHIRNLKFLGASDFVISRIETARNEANTQTMINLRVRTLLNGILLSLSQLTSSMVMLIGGLFVISGNITLGFLISSLQYSGRCESSLRSIMNLSTEIASNKMEFQRIYSVMLKKERYEVTEKNIISIERISIKNLHFSYDNTHKIFKDASAEFEKGKLHYIIGESGAGKTTLAKLLMGEYMVNDGTIYFNDTDINQFRIEELQQMITWVPNETVIWNADIKDNIICNSPYDEMRYMQVCKDCEIEKVQNELAAQKIVLGEKGSRISAGQKQRIGLARALFSSKPIVIIDEVTANLDGKTEQMIKRNINKYKDNKIIIIITHSKDFICKDAVIYEIKDRRILLRIYKEDVIISD